LLDAGGTLLYETRLSNPPVATPAPDGAWLVLDGATVERISGGARETVGSLGMTRGRAARMVADWLGNSYIYLGDAEETLMALGADGEVRWRARYPSPDPLPPLMAVGGGCLLYTLDADGMLNVFSTANGALVAQREFYAGGSSTGSVGARLLRADANERVTLSAGFLSLVRLDGGALGGGASECLLG
jgi:hypothetical protein